MANFAELTKHQDEIGKELERVISNYKKDSLSRKTPEYLEDRLKRLAELWTAFTKTDQELRVFETTHPDHPYFVNKYFKAMEREYLKTKEAIRQLRSEPKVGIAEARTDLQDSTLPFRTAFEGNTDLATLIRQQRSKMHAVEHIIDGINSNEGEQPSQYYDIKIAVINRYWDEVRHHHEMIGQSVSIATDLGYGDEDYERIEDRIQDVLILLSSHAERLKTNTSQALTPQTQMKLPQLTIPMFDGDYSKWKPFHDLFKQMVHEQQLGNAQKMWYLKMNLTGEPERLIRHMPISEENYSAAWELLNNRYNNKRLMVSTFMDRLMSQPTILQESASAIKKMHDVTNECLLGLKSLQLNIVSWDPILLHLLVKKLDKVSHNLYEQSLSAPRELQSITSLLNFLERRFQALETCGMEKRPISHAKSISSKTTTLVSAKDGATIRCKNCIGNHKISNCEIFKRLSISERIAKVRLLGLCMNCLRDGHRASQCVSRCCLKCAKRHNTLLHLDKGNAEGTIAVTPDKSLSNPRVDKERALSTVLPVLPVASDENLVTLSTEPSTGGPMILLSTAIIQALDYNGEALDIRVVLDSGSQINIITETAVKKLGLRPDKLELNIRGVGGKCQQAHQKVKVAVQSKITNCTLNLDTIVLPQIVSAQPTHYLGSAIRQAVPHNIRLADPLFDHPGSIDILIGAEVFYELMSIGQIRLRKGGPILQNTVFGWVVAGKLETHTPSSITCGISELDEENLNDRIERFWKLEESENNGPHMTTQELKCESEFAQNTKRTPKGRFVVKLPFRQDPKKLGNSKEIALRRFFQLERRLEKDPTLYTQYRQFMSEYASLGHMSRIDPSDISSPHYFLPHHCVLKPESTTTKLRVVFDASAKTTTGISLNEVLCTGPTIQDDLFTILLRFRLPRYVFTADIEKMYRQIMVAEQDRKYQLILWRDNPGEAIRYYNLNTVTYGTTTAPYLATKCLQELANQSAHQHPAGATALKHDFYMDDAMSGVDNLSDAIEKREQLQTILNAAGFKLRKWCANHSLLLQNIPSEEQALTLDLADEPEGQIKTLGLIWMPKVDQFKIRSFCNNSDKVTKRTALSDIAHLFDPLGLMSPVTVIAKMFLQRLWCLKVDWDAALPMELHSEWLRYREGLAELNQISIPRHVTGGKIPKNTQVHIFADASEKAYGAVAYLRAFHTDGMRTVHMLCAKSKVAPLKPITLPRLELCAAKLAAELAHRLKRDLRISERPFFYWTDSEIVLNWLISEASSFNTFVANRVSAIQQLSTPDQWRHVKSENNPADIVSRGMAPEKLKNCAMWFYGPMFLHGSEETWPRFQHKVAVEEGKKRPKVALATMQDETSPLIGIDHRNSLRRLQRIVAYVLRFIKNSQKAQSVRPHSATLTAEEQQDALGIIIKEAQHNEYRESINLLLAKKQLASNNTLIRLNPFLDDVGLMRSAGRLEQSDLPYDTKYPIILPYGHYVTRLILEDIHKQNLHAGPQALLAIARQKFWPIKGKTAARSVIQKCVRCIRTRPKLLSQLMGNLPAPRVQPARPFVNSGVDFAGPLWTHFKIRGKRPQKTYLAVFCCFATKAIHLELVTDLTTKAFIDALKRFMGRRGHCRNLYCDNATNFVGAKNQLMELKDSIYGKAAQQKIASFLGPIGIDFHFIPPKSPHFGGLWEAAVKSAKHLLIKNVAPAALTYEELETVLIEIEAILNSRPITPLSDDARDISALTPGHFLIGEPLTTAIDVHALPNNSTLPHRWKQMNDIKQKFWQRWSSEYLTGLQQRSKWKQTCENVTPSMFVLIKEDNLPPLKWQMGRISQVIKGLDGLVRVADIRTATGVLRRPIQKLAPLPINAGECNKSHTDEETSPARATKHKPTESRTAAANEELTSVNDLTTEPLRPKNRRIGNTAINLLLWASLVLPVTMSPLKIIPFQTPPGIYFESMGPVNVVLNEWNLIVHYNLTSYWDEMAAIRKGTESLFHICQQMPDHHSCSITSMQFHHLLLEIENGNKFLQPASYKSTHRTRRGAFNLVGNIANSLFGVLDSDYAIKMAEIIDRLDENDQHLLQLLKNQTSIIDSTANLMENMEKSTKHTLQHLNAALNRTMTRLNSISKELWDQEAAQTFSAAAIPLLLAANKYQRIQAMLINVLVDMHHGKINPQLLSRQQMLQALHVIKEELPPHLHLPVKPDNLLELYSIASIEGCIVADKVLFRLKLPLFIDERFELLHVVPVPTLVNETALVIQASTRYLVTNLNRDKYFPLSDQEITTCRRTPILNYICRQMHPLYQRSSDISKCEMSFISHTSAHDICIVKRLKNPPRWIQLSAPNHWFYFANATIPINIICDNTVSSRTLTGAGIIELSEDCVMKEEFATIQAHKLFPSNLHTSFVSTRNITEAILWNKTNVDPQESFAKHLAKLKEDLRTVRNNEVIQTGFRPADIHHFTLGYIGILGLLLVLIYLLWKCKQQPTPTVMPIPRPRTTTTKAFTVSVDPDE